MSRLPSFPPPPERQRPVNFRGRTRHPRARRTLELVEARKVDPTDVLSPPMWVCRWNSPLGPERVQYFGPNKQAALQLARSLAHHHRLLAVVEQIVHPTEEKP